MRWTYAYTDRQNTRRRQAKFRRAFIREVETNERRVMGPFA